MSQCPPSPGGNRRNHYRILHVQPDAPQAIVKSSYRALMLSLQMHPDHGGDHWNATLVNEAYEILSDPTRRAEYDRTIQADLVARGRRIDRSVTDDRRYADDRPSGNVTLVDHEPLRCAFCGASHQGAGPSATRSTCPSCKSPLTMADAPRLEDDRRRASGRVEREGDVEFWVVWPQPTPGRGSIVDLSAGGLQFESRVPLVESQIIKLDGPLLGAVSRVATCRARGDAFAIGVEFYTLRFKQTRGTFISTTA